MAGLEIFVEHYIQTCYSFAPVCSGFFGRRASDAINTLILMSNPYSTQEYVPLTRFNSPGLDRRQNGIRSNIRHGRRGLRNRVVRNIRRDWPRVIHWTLMLLMAIFLSYYFYEILVAA